MPDIEDQDTSFFLVKLLIRLNTVYVMPDIKDQDALFC